MKIYNFLDEQKFNIDHTFFGIGPSFHTTFISFLNISKLLLVLLLIIYFEFYLHNL